MLVGIFLVIVLAGCTQSSVPPGKYNAFAQCLTEKGVVEYGAFWCQHCAKVKANFGDAFQYVNYVECDPKGTNAQPQLCIEKNIEAYATFIFPDGTRLVGEPSMEELSLKSGCALPGA